MAAMRKIAARVSVVVGLLLATHLALADTIVHLKNGDVAAGTPVEITRGDHVTLKLATGDVRTYAWADIESVTDEIAKPVPPPVVITPAPAAAAAVPTGVLVHLDADDPHAMLATSSGYGEGGDGHVSIQIEEYRSFCMVPCDKSVPPGVYRIVGRDLVSTDDFSIPDGARSVQLAATMHGRARRGWGKVLSNGGGVFSVVGVFFLIIAPQMKLDPSGVPNGIAYDPGFDNRSGFYAMGGVTLGVGVALLVGGIYLLATGSSSVEVKTTQNGVGRFLSHGMQLSF